MLMTKDSEVKGEEAMKNSVNNEMQGEVEIDLQKLLFAYLKKWWLIVLCGVLLGGAVLFCTMQFITPIYRASITIYVNNARSGEFDYITSSNLQASQQLVNTYTNIINSDMVLEEIASQADVGYTAKDLRGILSTAQVDSTELFRVYIKDPDPERAAYIANVVADVVPGILEDFVEGSSARIVDYAKVPETRYSPSYSRNALLGAFIGCLLAAAYITLCCLLDVRIKSEEDLAMVSDLPVLGRIPEFGQAGTKRSAYETRAAASVGKEG